MSAADAVIRLMAELDAFVPRLNPAEIVFRASADGRAHVTFERDRLGLCGAVGTSQPITAGAPCGRCLELAARWVD